MIHGALLAQTKLRLDNPITGTEKIASPVIGAFLIAIAKSMAVLLAIAAVAMILYGGFMWMTARGEKERIETAKQTLFWAVAGLVVVAAAYAGVRFVITELGRIFFR